MRHKLGGRPFIHTLHTARRFAVMHAALESLGAPPLASTAWGERTEYITGDLTWGGMLGNGPDPHNPPQYIDGVGDCVICDDLRCIMLWEACAKGVHCHPTTAEAYQLYERITGFPPDNGTDPTVNANYMVKTGYQGHRYADWAPVDPQNDAHIKWAIQSFGCVKFGMDFPDFAEDQFGNDQPWDYTGQPYKIEGGHDVLAVQYEVVGGNTIWDVVTWAKRIHVTERFKNKFMNMVIAPLSLDFTNSVGSAPNGLNVPALQARLAAVTN